MLPHSRAHPIRQYTFHSSCLPMQCGVAPCDKLSCSPLRLSLDWCDHLWLMWHQVHQTKVRVELIQYKGLWVLIIHLWQISGLFIAHCIASHIVYYTSNIGLGQQPDGEAEGQALAMNLFWIGTSTALASGVIGNLCPALYLLLNWDRKSVLDISSLDWLKSSFLKTSLKNATIFVLCIILQVHFVFP